MALILVTYVKNPNNDSLDYSNVISLISDLHYSLFLPIAYFETARRAYVEVVLGVFEKAWEKRLLASSCLFFHPSACHFVRMDYLGSHWTDFLEILVLYEGVSVKCMHQLHILLKWNQNDNTLHVRTCLCLYYYFVFCGICIRKIISRSFTR
jgi:hypothetical protein